MSKKLKISFFTFFCFFLINVSYGQDKYGQLGFCKGNCFTETLSEFAQTAGKLKETHNVLIRLCTKDRLEIALSKVYSNIRNLNFWLKTNEINVSEIPILLSKSCANEPQSSVLFQLLAYSKDYQKPPFKYDTTLKIKDFDVTMIEEKSIETKVDKFALLLKDNPEAFGTIFGEYNYRPSSKLKQNLQKTKLLMTKKKIRSSRYLIEILPTGFKNKPPDPEPDEIIFQIIKINRNKNQ